MGRTILQYQFLEKLGSGGMGEIYKAQDKRLNRFVAVKILSSANAGDPDHRRRFLLEAQAASALSHPNIITIHDILNEDDADFMVMEFVAGRTLVEMVPKGGLPVPLALKLSVQIADALSAAHAAGIVHRDLKPGNVMVTDAGLVKILDFGLAKFTGPEPLADDGVTRTIQKAPLTVEGSIIGTVSYMSPEQAQGRKVDARSDIFSFGLVLYEMLTGERAFAADSALGTLTAILRDEHRPLTESAAGTPPQLEELVARCLKKNPEERWQSMPEVLAVLNGLKRESETGTLLRPPNQASQTSRVPAAVPPLPRSSRSELRLALRLLFVIIVILIGRSLWVKQQRANSRTAARGETSSTTVGQPGGAEKKPGDETLDNDAVISMVKARVATSVIISEIRSAKTNFVLTPSELIRLSKARVPASVIEVMQHPNAPVSGQPEPGANASAPGPPVVAPPAGTPESPAQSVSVPVSDAIALPIILSEDIPVTAEEGQSLRFITTSELKIGDVIVVAKGAVVIGQVVDFIPRRKLFGRSAGVKAFALQTVEAVDGHKLNLRATAARNKDRESRHLIDVGGRGRTRDVQAGAGSRYVAYVDGDQTVAVRK